MADTDPTPGEAQLLSEIAQPRDQIAEITPAAATRQADLVFSEVHKKILALLTIWAAPFATILIILGWSTWDARKLGEDVHNAVATSKTDIDNTLKEIEALNLTSPIRALRGT
jgi:hypothetical protein